MAPSSPWPRQPVLVTSTFRDMQAEREYLHRVVFARLGERLAAERIQLEPIDIAGKSVTAVEIEAGVPGDRGHSRRFYYFREPLPYDRMPAEAAALYSDAFHSNPGVREDFPQRLERRKQRMRDEAPDRVRSYQVAWDEAAEQERATCYERIGDLESKQRNLSQAAASYSHSLEIRERWAGPAPSAATRACLASGHEKVGEFLRRQSDWSGAAASFRRAMELRRGLAEQDPNAIRARVDLAIDAERLGEVLQRAGSLADAMECYQTALATRESLARRGPADPGLQHDLAACHERLGDALLAAGEWDGALAAFESLVEVRDGLAARDRTAVDLQSESALCRRRVAELCMRKHDPAGVAEQYGAPWPSANGSPSGIPASTTSNAIGRPITSTMAIFWRGSIPGRRSPPTGLPSKSASA